MELKDAEEKSLSLKRITHVGTQVGTHIVKNVKYVYLQFSEFYLLIIAY